MLFTSWVLAAWDLWCLVPTSSPTPSRGIELRKKESGEEYDGDGESGEGNDEKYDAENGGQYDGVDGKKSVQ